MSRDLQDDAAIAKATDAFSNKELLPVRNKELLPVRNKELLPVRNKELLPVRTQAPRQKKRRASKTEPTLARLVVAAVVAAIVAALFKMPFVGDRATEIDGVPFPAGAVFVIGTVAIQGARRRRTLQQFMLPFVSAVFFAFGAPLLLTPFAPAARLGFFLAFIGAVVALYEWAVVG